jgi:hypothetical protein
VRQSRHAVETLIVIDRYKTFQDHVSKVKAVQANEGKGVEAFNAKLVEN